jgi:hypothetical protein
MSGSRTLGSKTVMIGAVDVHVLQLYIPSHGVNTDHDLLLEDTD